MKRSTWDGATVVYRYGCPSWAELPEAAMTQMRLGHNLRNALVAVEHRYREMLAAVSLTHPDVAVAQARVDECDAAVRELTDRARDERSTDRTTIARTSTKGELATARLARTEAKAALKLVKAATRNDRLPMLDQLAAARVAALSALHVEAKDAGLFWGTADAVLKDHHIAAKQVAEAWKRGRPAQRRFQRWDGTGTLTTQVMMQQGKPRRSPQLLASGEGPWRNVFQLSPWMPPERWPAGRGSHRHGLVKVRVEKGGDLIELPVIVHRLIPADGDIAFVQITRRRIGAQFRLSVALTVRLPAPEPASSGVPVSVVMGWAAAGSGAVRVARLASPFGGLSVPAPVDVAECLVPGDGFVDVVAPASWRVLLERDDAIRGHRDDLLDELRPQVVAALADAGVAEVVGVTDGQVSLWRAPRRFAALCRVWPPGHPLSAVLAAWRLRDLHLWDFEAHERDQVIARRRDAWRKVAAWVCGQASEVLLDCPNVAGLREAPPVGVEDTREARAGRRQVQFGAPGDFRAALLVAADRRGVKVIDVRSGDGG